VARGLADVWQDTDEDPSGDPSTPAPPPPPGGSLTPDEVTPGIHNITDIPNLPNMNPRFEGGGGGEEDSGGGGSRVPAPASIRSSGLGDFKSLGLDPFYDELLKGIRESRTGPFDPDTLNHQKALLFQTAQGRAAAEKEELGRDLIRRGISRSGVAVEKKAGIERAASSDFGTEYTKVLVNAVQENYKARVEALKQEANALQLRQTAMLTLARNQLDKDIANANIALGYARIQAEAENLRAQLESAFSLARENNQSALERLLLELGSK